MWGSTCVPVGTPRRKNVIPNRVVVGGREKYQLPLVPVTPPSSLSQNGVREQELDALRYYTRVAPTQPAMQNTWQ